MRLLLLACLRARTGNATTAARIQNHLHAAGHICVLKDAFMYESQTEIANLISTDKFDGALAIHLYKGGRLLQGSRIPFGIIFGGTDVNEDVNCEEKHRVMGAVLEEARFAVAFTVKMKELAATEWPDARKKIYVQTQGIKTTPKETFDWYKFLQNAAHPQFVTIPMVLYDICRQCNIKCPAGSRLAVANVQLVFIDKANVTNQATAIDRFDAELLLIQFLDMRGDIPGIWLPGPDPAIKLHNTMRKCIPTDTGNLHVFLLICGLRRVKDPLYLVDAFSDWHRKEPSIHLGIIGPAVDPLFTSEIKDKVKRAPGVHLLQEMSQDDLHAAMKRCFAVVNSSISEGMSAAILEAMDLNIPVLARNIPGNAAIIKHKETGLLFSDPQEFVVLSKSLMNDPIMEKEIVTRAKDYMKKHHSWESERKAYENLVLRLQ